jgi:Bifunctional DNA primase/polymerase, N-terminal
MSTGVMTDRVFHLHGLLGPAVFLPWPSGSKGNHRKWKHLQLSDMTEPGHQSKLERAGNIGVALGQVSNGLVTIDLDEDNYVDAFLAANPLLKTTLRTRASRGCNIWVRCSSEYPPSQRLKNTSGAEIGEWRADGSQTIIIGTHPEGMLYQFVVEKPAITIVYGAIIWPESILPPRATESNRVRRVRENEVVAACSSDACSSSIEGFISEDSISQLAPTDFRQNNASLFNLARLVKSNEDAVTRLATPEELEFAFERWCEVARRFWRHTRNDYWAEFLQAYHYARIGLNQDPIKLAFERARKAALPKVTGFTDGRVRLLAGICREMERLIGNHSFFLPTRKLGELFGVHWSTVARWLVAFEPLGIIHLAPGEVRRRGGIRCPRYRHGPPVTETVS